MRNNVCFGCFQCPFYIFPPNTWTCQFYRHVVGLSCINCQCNLMEKQSFKKLLIPLYVLIGWLIIDFMKGFPEVFPSSVGKQLEDWLQAQTFDTCHLALDEGSVLPKIVGVVYHRCEFSSLLKNLLWTVARNNLKMEFRSLGAQSCGLGTVTWLKCCASSFFSPSFR